MADEPEEGFVIRDRRRFTGELSEEKATPATQQKPPVEAQAAPDFNTVPPSLMQGFTADEEIEENADYALGDSGDNTLPDIYSVLILFLGEMRNHALLRMGLVPNPMTGQSERDLEQARIAINTAVFLAEQLESVLPQEERLPLKAMLSDLQMNYIEQARRGQ